MPDIVTIERSVARPFVAIDATILTVRVQAGKPHQGLSLKGEADVLPLIETKVEGDTLFVKPREGASFSTNTGLELELDIPDLERIVASAGAQVTVNNLQGSQLDVTAHSGGQVKLVGQAQSVRAFAESGGTVDLRKLSSRSVSSQGRSGGRIL